jgi:hypothetical protein
MFDVFLRQAGLSAHPGLNLLQAQSPFEYRASVELVIAAMGSDPSGAADP